MGRVSAGNTDGGMDEREEESAEQGGGGGQTVCGQQGCFGFHCKQNGKTLEGLKSDFN